MNSPKVVLVNGAQFGYSSGHFYYCKYLKDKFSISYICFDRGLKRIDLEGIQVIYVPFTGNKILRYYWFLKVCIAYCSQLKPDLLIVTYFYLCFPLSLFCSSKKSILDIRTGSLRENKLLRRLENFYITTQVLFFDGIITLSESLKKRLLLPSQKTRIIPLGSDVYYSGYHLFSDIRLLYIGALDNRNIGDTIIALDYFIRSTRYGGELKYTIIAFGSDYEIAKIINLIADRKLQKIVNYVGRLSNEELFPYFMESNVGVVYIPQTAGYDCQPATKLFEYMLSGMPVIATKTSENESMVNEMNGILVDASAEDFAEGLKKLIQVREKYSSSEIRHFVDTYRWENIVHSKLAVYLLELLNENSGCLQR
jgi:glycosyltransferase involved in cell wall biosynthesis